MTDLATTEAPRDLDRDLAEPIDREAWRIDGDREATWAVRKIAAAKAEQARAKSLWQAERERLDAWLADATAGPQHDIDFFTNLLVGYRHRLEDENPDLPKTYRVPGGKITRRQAPQRVEVTDPDALVLWALDNAAELLRIEPAKAAIAKLAKADDGTIVSPDGEPLPGARWERDPDIYAVSVDAFGSAEPTA